MKQECENQSITQEAELRGVPSIVLLDVVARQRSEIRQLYAILDDSIKAEDECIGVLEPLVGYNRDLPYVMRLSGAVRQLAANYKNLLSNSRINAE